MHTRENPFIGYSRIVSGERLVGRETAVDRLVRWLSGDDGSLNLVGMPRVGKSSLVGTVLEELRARRPELVIVSVTLGWYQPGEMAPKLFFDDLRRLVMNELHRLGLPQPQIEHGTTGSLAYDAFTALRDTLAEVVRQAPQARFVAVVDDFDRVSSWSAGADVIHQLRAIVDHAPEYRMSFVLVSKRRLRVIEMVLLGVSILADLCHVNFVRPLDEDGLRTMLRRGYDGAEPPPEEVAKLMAITGGHPFLAEMLLYHAWERGSLAAGAEDASTQTLEFYGLLRRLLELDDMFTHMLRAAVRPRLKVPSLAFDSLRDYGLVLPNGAADDGPRAWSDHFQLFLERSRREAEEEGETWALWRRTEIAVRGFIESTLSEAVGEKWEEWLRARHDSIAEVFDECAELAERERRSFRLAETGRLLDYTYPADLWQIISKEWSHFQPRLPGIKKVDLARAFDTMARIRARVAHNRVVPSDEEEAARLAYRQVLNVITSAEGATAMA